MYKRNGSLGAEEFGPSAPTITQKAGQVVTDIDKSVESVTGVSNVAYYLGIALIGYVAYTYMQGE